MRSLTQRATTALLYLCAFFALVLGIVGVVGIVGVRSAAGTGNSVTDDELATSTTTAQLARSVDAAYATGEIALLSSAGSQRSTLTSLLYTQLVPRVDRTLVALSQLHATDAPVERSDIDARLTGQWTAVRDLLGPTAIGAGPQPGLAGRLTAEYLPLGAHLDQLLTRERTDATAAEARASARSATTVWVLVAALAAGLAATAAFALTGTRRVRRATRPEQDQSEFADTLQIAGDEQEAHHLLQHHLERSLSDTTAVVLNRNNSADRLEAVTPVPDTSPLWSTLRGAEPRSCLAVRSGRTHTETTDRPGLLVCQVCAPCPGHSTCTPLTVGGEVIGSVLLNRPAPYNAAEDQRIRESVSQAAPVLANLRNLAIAEIRAATDGLTGLPNKRAVTDTSKRMFAQSSRTGTPLSLVLLDLDHFKQINDLHGHPVGDQVLANVGAVLRSALRAGDFAGRNGGEEFALLLPETDAAGGYEIAQRVRAAISEIAVPGLDVSVTASLGVAGYPDHVHSLERLERLADAALFIAKRSGRNRTEMANPDIEQPLASRPATAGPMAPDLDAVNGHATDGQPDPMPIG